MLEIGQKVFYCIHDLGFGEVVTVEDGFQFIKESIHFDHGTTGGFLNYTKGLKTLQIDLLPRDVESLVGFLPSGVGGELDAGRRPR